MTAVTSAPSSWDGGAYRTRPSPTYRERVLMALMASGGLGVCLSELPVELGYTLRNRVGELRQAGYTIEGSRCDRHAHRSTVQRYVLRSEPVQLELVP